MVFGVSYVNKRHFRYLTELLSLPTAPFSEYAVTNWVEAFAAKRPALSLRKDKWGNVLIRYPGKRASRRKLVFSAHMDHPGFTALGMNAKGMLECCWVGGVPNRLFAGMRVRFFSNARWVKGVVKSSVPHPTLPAVRNVAVKTRGRVEPGSVGMWDFPDPRVRGHHLIARGCDDVAGVATIIAVLDEAIRRNVKQAFHVLLTRAEEGGLFGAVGACTSGTLPKGAVVITVETSKELPGARQGNGPIVRVGDRASVFTPSICGFLSGVAANLAKRAPSFKFQRKLMDGGTTESSVFQECGHEVGAFALALHNYHNVTASGKKIAPERIDLHDYENLIRLCLGMLDEFKLYSNTCKSFRLRAERYFRKHKHLLRSMAPARGDAISRVSRQRASRRRGDADSPIRA
jgi:endoglucanase